MSTEIETIKSGMMAVAHKLHTGKELTELEKRQAAWFGYGTRLHNKNMEWSALAAAAIEGIKLVQPHNIEDVPAAEKALQQAKAGFRAIEQDRLETTKLQDSAKERLMQHEKAGQHEIQRLTDDIIRIKSRHESQAEESRKKEHERQRIILSIKNSVVEQEAGFKSKIASELNQVYKLAFDLDIVPEKIDGWLVGYLGRFTSEHFKLSNPLVSFSHHSASEIEAIISEYNITDPAAFAKQWRDDLKEKFSDYAVAYLNRDAAIERNDSQLSTDQILIHETRTHAHLAAQVEAASTPLEMEVAIPVKELKRSWKVDMDDSFTNAQLITAAFWSNIEKCKTYLRVTKWFSLTPSQMATALGKVKTEDVHFSATGIKFKEETKI